MPFSAVRRYGTASCLISGLRRGRALRSNAELGSIPDPSVPNISTAFSSSFFVFADDVMRMCLAGPAFGRFTAQRAGKAYVILLGVGMVSHGE